MAGSNTLGNGQYVYTTALPQDQDETAYAGIFNGFADDLAKFGIDAQVSIDRQKVLRIEFSSEADLVVFRDRMDHTGHKENTVYAHEFVARDEVYEKVWTASAVTALNESGISCEVEHRDHVATFKLPNYLSQVMFKKLIETGFMDQKAELCVEHKISPTGDPTWKPDTPGF